MSGASGFTTREAALFAGLSEGAIRHEMGREAARAGRGRTGAPAGRRMTATDILYLRLIAALPVTLKVEDRRDLHALLRHRGLRERGRWTEASGRLRLRGGVEVAIDTRSIRRDLARDLAAYRRGRRRAVSTPEILGGEPVFAGTRIPIAHVGALLAKGVPPADVLEDYPGLDAADLEFARLAAAIGDGARRRRKPLAFTRAG